MASLATPITTDRYYPTSWQLEDLEKLSAIEQSCNFSEMGTYKTSTGLWLLEEKTKWTTVTDASGRYALVVTTQSGKGTYFDAVPKCLPGWRLFNLDSRGAHEVLLGKFKVPMSLEELFGKLAKDEIEQPAIVLAHYNLFMDKSPIRELLQAIMWPFVLVDEAHRIKDKDSQWTRNLKKLSSVNRHVMTGRGFVNRPDELYSLLNFLEPKTYGSYWKFRDYFCVDWVLQQGYRKFMGLNEDRLNEFRALVKHHGVRRMMREVHQDIAEPIVSKREIELTAIQRRIYDEIKDDLYALDQAGIPITSPNVLSQLNRLRQICVATPRVVTEYFDEQHQRRVQEITLEEPSAKLDEVMSIIDELDDPAEQVVVFSNFNAPLALLKARLVKKNIPFIHMQEKDSADVRYRKWHDDWPKKEHKVFLTNVKLGGESINLSSAETVVFLDRSWSPNDNAQAVSRLWRPGQKGVVHVIHIEAVKTTDQRIEKAVASKEKWFRMIFDEEDQDG